MNRDQLIGALPTGAQFNGAPQWQKKEIVENFIDSILDAIAAEGREPDDWEAHDVAAAIGFVMAGLYRAAIAAAERALVPVEQRSPIQSKDPQDPPAAAQLRDALSYARGIPAKNY